MGALSSRRMIMDVADEDDDSPSRIEDTSDDSDPDFESDSDYGHEHFVSVLRNLISTGQFFLRGRDEDDFVHSPGRVPRIKVAPDTTLLDKSEYSLITKEACGLFEPPRNGPRVKNVASLLMNRERAIYRTQNFSVGTKRKISCQYVPNEMVGALEETTGKVFCGIFSPDGSTFMTACQDRHIRLYDAKDCTYKLIKSVRARDVGWSIIDVAFSPKADHFVYSTWSSTLHMCSINGVSEHQEPLSLLNTSRRFCVFSVVYSSDGKELVCGGNDGALYVYDLEKQKRILKILGHEYDTNRVLFADNTSHIIYSGGDDGLVKVWDRRALGDRNAKPVGVLAGHMDGVTYIDSRGDGRYLISNSKDQSIKLWDVRVFSNDSAADQSLKAVRNQPWDYRWQDVPKEMFKPTKLIGDTSVMTYRGHAVLKTLIRARFSPAETTGQRFIYTGCGYGRVVIYDSLTGKIVKQRKGHMACVRDVSWHPTRNEILSSSWDGLVGKWKYCKPSGVIEKQDTRNGSKPLRRSARLAAMRMKASSPLSSNSEN